LFMAGCAVRQETSLPYFGFKLIIMMLVLPATVSDDRGGFSCFSARNTIENHKNISFLIFFCQNIWWYILFDISLQCQNKITNN